MTLKGWNQRLLTAVTALFACVSTASNGQASELEYQEPSIRQTGLTEFSCSDDKNGVPTVFVYTQRSTTPIMSWAYSERSINEARRRCRTVAVRLQQFYNCGILDSLEIDALTIFVKVNPETKGKCPALKPDRDGKLLLLSLEPGIDLAQISEQLDDIRVGAAPDRPICIRDRKPSSLAANSQNNECKPIAIVPPSSLPTSSPPSPDIEQITSVSQLSDVQTTDWAYQALKSLVDRYGVIAGYPDRTFRGSRTMTRYEFAAGLEAASSQIKERLDASTASLTTKEDLLALRRLQEEFATELASLRDKVNALEVRTATLEKQQFSTTTKLFGEAIFAITNTFGQDNLSNTAFQNRVRLELQTSFTGKDVLHTRLTAGNVIASLKPDNTAEGTQQFAIGNTIGNQVRVDWLSYLFPVGTELYVYVSGFGGIHSDYVYSTFNPYLQDYDGGNGALSVFGQESPIYRIGGGAGVALNYKFLQNDALTFTLGYLAGPNANDPSRKNGLFNGNYAFLGQATFGSPDRRLQLGLTYVHAYNSSDTPIFNQGSSDNQFYTGSTLANAHFGRPVNTDSAGIEASFKISPKLAISGFLGYTQFSVQNRKNEEIWYYSVNFAFPDLGKRGNLGGLVVGVEPYIASQTRSIPTDISLHVEAFYRYQLTDSISITPGLIWISAPNQKADNDSLFIATFRLTFRF